MNIEVVYWKLGNSDPAIHSLNELIDKECISLWSKVGNIKDKIWFEDPSGGYWGAIMIWEKEKPDLSQLPPNSPREIIGRAPDVRLSFNLLSRI